MSKQININVLSMKKIILSIALVMSVYGTLSAQSNGKAIGVRGGGGGEISFQTALGGNNRLELDLGLNSWNSKSDNGGFGLSGVYQWVWNLDALAQGFNWYVGFGPQIGSWNNSSFSGFALGIVGQIGLEYNFNIPLQLSLDYRPSWYILPNNYGGAWGGTAFAIRYTF